MKWDKERIINLAKKENLTILTNLDDVSNLSSESIIEWLCHCGKHTFFRRVTSVNQGQINCKECTKQIQKSTRMRNIKDVELDINIDGYKLISDKYLGSHKKHTIMCPNGHIFEMSISSFKNGQRCKKCSDKKLSERYSKGKKKYSEELFIAHDGNIDIVGDYKNNQTKTLHKCNTCGTEWLAYPANMLRGFGCPTCGLSKGEQKIQEYLVKNNISFISEYIFNDLLSDKGFPLRFDFAIFNEKKLVALIEYDGEFHFFKKYKTQDFDKQLKHDAMKNKYCADKKINLIRIPYSDIDNITEILNEKLLSII